MEMTDKIDLLSKLVSYDTRNGNERKAMEFLGRWLSDRGVRTEVLPFDGETSERANLVAEIGNGTPVIAFTGHMDVVDFNKDDWDTDPLELTVEGNKMYGRGSTDMKSGVAAASIAIAELVDKKQKLNGTIRLLITAGEEAEMEGSEVLKNAGYMDDVDALLVGEPSAYNATFASKGELDVVLKSVGKAAHSSMPEFGINAIQNLMDVWHLVKDELDLRSDGLENEYLGKAVYNMDTVTGGRQANVIPESAEACINIRTIPELGNEDVIEIFQEKIDEFNKRHDGTVSFEVPMQIVPIVGDPDSDLIKDIQLVSEEKYGQKIELVAMPGGTDGSKLLFDRPSGFPFAVFGPGAFETAHQANEYCLKDMYLNFTEIYEEIFVRLLEQL